MKVSEEEVKKEMREHPWASRELAERIALDHKLMKTTTKEGKRIYMRSYMQERRQREKAKGVPDLGKMLGLDVRRKEK